MLRGLATAIDTSCNVTMFGVHNTLCTCFNLINPFHPICTPSCPQWRLDFYGGDHVTTSTFMTQWPCITLLFMHDQTDPWVHIMLRGD